MTGWLVVNHFIKSDKFIEIFEWLETAAKLQGIQMIRKTNAELMPVIGGWEEIKLPEPKPDFVLFWDKDIRLAKFLELKGLRLFNSAKAIETCDDKSLTHISLLNAGIRMPKTVISPKTFERSGYGGYEFLEEVIHLLGLPVVIKECFGSFGQQVYLANNREELYETVKRIGIKPMLFQEFIASSRGRDIRINVVGGESVAAMYRYSENDDFRANITNGAKMKQYNPSSAQIQMAVSTCEKLKLDFAGVDILFGENEEPILCEVNSNAHFKNIFDCTGINVANFIIKHILKEMQGGCS